MNDTELNKFLQEKVMGACWHEFTNKPEDWKGSLLKRCIQCGMFFPWREAIPDFLNNPLDYWRLWEKVGTNDDFWNWYYEKCLEDYAKNTSIPSKPEGFAMDCSTFWQVYIIGNLGSNGSLIINKQRFCTAIAEFFTTGK